MALLDARLGTDIDHADQRFSGHFADEVVSQSTRRTQLNAVMPHESGVTLDELQRILDELVILGLETPDAVVAWERGARVATLREETDWADDRVARGLEFWNLRRRGSFYSIDDNGAGVTSSRGASGDGCPTSGDRWCSDVMQAAC